MATHFKTHTFKLEDAWETIDTYWSSPLSFWAKKSLRIEPPVPLRVSVLGRVLDESNEGWINYGGVAAMFVVSVQARGLRGQRVRALISDEPVFEEDA